MNEDWKKSGIALTAANLLSNIFVDGGLTGQNDVISYFCLKIYGTKNPSGKAHPDKDEIQEVLNLGYSEIKDFGQKLTDELAKHLSGELYPNATAR